MDIVIEKKGCTFCRNVRGVPGDEWQQHGYFVFGETAVHIELLEVRALVDGGTPITTAWRGLLQHLETDLIWMGEPTWQQGEYREVCEFLSLESWSTGQAVL